MAESEKNRKGLRADILVDLKLGQASELEPQFVLDLLDESNGLRRLLARAHEALSAGAGIEQIRSLLTDIEAARKEPW